MPKCLPVPPLCFPWGPFHGFLPSMGKVEPGRGRALGCDHRQHFSLGEPCTDLKGKDPRESSTGRVGACCPLRPSCVWRRWAEETCTAHPSSPADTVHEWTSRSVVSRALSGHWPSFSTPDVLSFPPRKASPSPSPPSSPGSCHFLHPEPYCGLFCQTCNC